MLEFISEIHRKLDQMSSVNPVVTARSDLAEVIQESDSAPSAVHNALEAISGDVDEEDAQQAADLLRPILEGTNYSPDVSDSYYLD